MLLLTFGRSLLLSFTKKNTFMHFSPFHSILWFESTYFLEGQYPISWALATAFVSAKCASRASDSSHCKQSHFSTQKIWLQWRCFHWGPLKTVSDPSLWSALGTRTLTWFSRFLLLLLYSSRNFWSRSTRAFASIRSCFLFFFSSVFPLFAPKLPIRLPRQLFAPQRQAKRSAWLVSNW